MTKDSQNWHDFCVNLRMGMFRSQQFETILGIEEIYEQSKSQLLLATLQKPAYWKSSRIGRLNCEAAAKNGIEIQYNVEQDCSVCSVTFSLDESRRGTLERFIEKQASHNAVC